MKRRNIISLFTVCAALILCALLALPFGATVLANAQNNTAVKVAYYNFEDGNSDDFTVADGTVSVQTENPISGGKSLTLAFDSDITENAKLTAFTAANDTVYTLIFKFTALSSSDEFTVSVNSASASYAGYRLSFTQNAVTAAVSVTGDAADRKNYELRKEAEYSVMKFTFWSGYESDWGVKFGGEKDSQLTVDELAIYVGVEIDTAAYYSTADDAICEDAENGSLFGGGFYSANYAPSAARDGRITSATDEVIDGSFSIAATASSVSDWQPFIQSENTLEYNEVYTVAFDYRHIAGNGRLGVNVGTQGDFYRIMYLNKNGFAGAEAGMTDGQIGSGASGWIGNYYGDHNCAYYVIDRGDRFSVKFTFVNCVQNASVRFVMPNNNGADNDTRYVIDNIRVLKGTIDLMPETIQTPPTPITAKFTEDFEEAATAYSFGPTAFYETDAPISGKKSARSSSRGDWADGITFKTFSFIPDSTYTVTFRYRINSCDTASFAYINVKNPDNADDASFLGFDADGARNDFSGRVLDACFDNDFLYNTATVTFSLGTSSNYRLVFGSKGATDFTVDDIVIAEGAIPLYSDAEANDAVLRITAQENFENGYGIFDDVSDDETPCGIMVYSQDETINGKYSVKGESQTGLKWIVATSPDATAIASGKTYTLLFRFTASQNAVLYAAIQSNAYGVQKSLAALDCKGRRFVDISHNVVSVYSEIKNGVCECRVIITAPEASKLSLRFGVSDGLAVIDDVILYEGVADVRFTSDALYEEGGTAVPPLAKQPSSHLPEADCALQSGTTFNEITVTFTDAVVLKNGVDMQAAVRLTGKDGNVEITSELSVAEKKLTVTFAQNALTPGQTYILTVEGFEDAYGTAVEKLEKSFVYGAVEPDTEPDTEPGTDSETPNEPEDGGGCHCGIYELAGAFTTVGVLLIIASLAAILFKRKNSTR